VTGSTWSSLGVPSNKIDECVEVCLRAKQTGSPATKDSQGFLKNSDYWIWWSTMYCGEMVWSFFSQDITPQKKLEKELQKTVSKLEIALQVKSRFLANMSHEIRTPLTGIRGAITLLRDTSLSEQQLENVNLARICLDQLLVTVNDILDISKIEADKMIIVEEPFVLCDLAEECVNIVSVAAEEKSIDLLTDIDPTVPFKIASDSTRIKQIIVNLLSNAIKFSESGGTVILTVLKQCPTKILITVEDEGIESLKKFNRIYFSRSLKQTLQSHESLEEQD